jgi:hypothetical protein
MGPMVRMVTPDSATWALPTEAIHMQIPIDADHSTMVKYSDNYDPHYITVRDRLYKCVKNAPALIESRLAREASLGECMWIFKINPQDTKSAVGASEPLFMVPFFRNPDFVGRKDTLDQLESLLSPEGDDQRRAALCGLGGIG